MSKPAEKFIPFSLQKDYYERLGDIPFESDNKAITFAESGKITQLSPVELGKSFLKRADEHLATASMLVKEGVAARSTGNIGWSQTTFYYASFHAARGLGSLCGNMMVSIAGAEKIIRCNMVPSRNRLHVKGEIANARGAKHKKTWYLLEDLFDKEPPPHHDWLLESAPDPDNESKLRNKTSYSPKTFVELARQAKTVAGFSTKDFPLHEFDANRENREVERKAVARTILLTSCRAKIDVEFSGIPKQDISNNLDHSLDSLEVHYAKPVLPLGGFFDLRKSAPPWRTT
jgi:hypothetical protein